jgi:hypothetical protein
MRTARVVFLVLLCLATSSVLCAQAAPSTKPASPSVSVWTDQKVASEWRKNLKNLTDQLDDCTYKGRFSNRNAVPDECNGAI